MQMFGTEPDRRQWLNIPQCRYKRPSEAQMDAAAAAVDFDVTRFRETARSGWLGQNRFLSLFHARAVRILLADSFLQASEIG